jgi:hypothetical protein
MHLSMHEMLLLWQGLSLVPWRRPVLTHHFLMPTMTLCKGAPAAAAEPAAVAAATAVEAAAVAAMATLWVAGSLQQQRQAAAQHT